MPERIPYTAENIAESTQNGYKAGTKSPLLDNWGSISGHLKALEQGNCLTRAEIAVIEPQIKHCIVVNTVRVGLPQMTTGNQSSLWPSSLE